MFAWLQELRTKTSAQTTDSSQLQGSMDPPPPPPPPSTTATATPSQPLPLPLPVVALAATPSDYAPSVADSSLSAPSTHIGVTSAGKKKRGRGRPPKRRAGDEGGGSKPRGRTTTPRPRSRRPSSSTGLGEHHRNSGPQLELVSDEAPARYVNPLLEIPSEASQNEPIPGSELLAITDLIFSKPDTYPLSYMARLLGFDVPVPDIMTTAGSSNPANAAAADETKDGDSSANAPNHPTFPTPFPPVESLPFLSRDPHKDPFLQIPPAPTRPGLPDILRRRCRRHPQLARGDEADAYTLDCVDPVYAHLLQQGFVPKQCKAGTSTLTAKLAAPLKQPTMAKTRDQVVAWAQTHLPTAVDWKDWTFGDWSSSLQHHKPNTPGCKRIRPRWTLDGTKIYSHPPSQAFGVVASYKGHPVALLQYKFQWYPIVQESELVMVVEGFGNRRGSEVQVVNTVPTPAPSALPQVSATEGIATTEATAPADEKAITESEGIQTDAAADVTTATTSSVEDTTASATATSVTTATTPLAPPPPTTTTTTTITEGDESAPPIKLSDPVRLVMLALALDHARAADVWYALWGEAPSDLTTLNRDCFRMVALPRPVKGAKATDRGAAPEDPSNNPTTTGTNERETQQPSETSNTTTPWICDLKKCSSKYALLKYKEGMNSSTKSATSLKTTTEQTTFQERLLVQMPTLEEATIHLDSELAEKQRSKRVATPGGFTVDDTEGEEEGKKDSGQRRIYFGNPAESVREVTIRVQAKLQSDSADDKYHKVETLQLRQDDAWQSVNLPDITKDGWMKDVGALPSIKILRHFPLPEPLGQKQAMDATGKPENEETKASSYEDEILAELKAKQAALLAAEEGMESRLRGLMAKVVDERLAYERPEARKKREEDRQTLKHNEELMARRKEVDQAWQEQLEEDMNAVCNICNDGEVTPDNQILFCEACNVPVHQMCYGIEEVPEGDYYCIPCQYFGREKMSQELKKRSGDGPRISLPPLPIRCELCPVKKGAYIRCDTSKSDPNSAVSKWVHMACAKWQGLNFVEKGKPDLVEDVTELKKYFRRYDLSCAICAGKRGAYHQCRAEGCEKWLHITCARAIGTCEVIHGEDVDGPVMVNPWTLLCPEHSKLEEAPTDPVPIEHLVRLSKELPNDPMPEPIPEAHKPFNKQNGKERRRSLADPKYEAEFLEELLSKKFAGLRCQVCDTIEDDGKSLMRCTDCRSVVCFTCRFTDDEVGSDQKYFKCRACKEIDEPTQSQEEFVKPQCQLCNKKGGLLMESFANPVNRLSYWKKNFKEFQRTLFSKPFWAHYTCAFWLQGLQVDYTNQRVDCSNVVMANGRAFIRSSTKCSICGLSTGLKAKCDDEYCRARGETKSPYNMHISCARQIGYEVNHSDHRDPSFYVRCYFHAGCEFNLRAQLEDLIEIEKRRAGKKFGKADAPMTFADASRLLSQSIAVVRILGWAWRWAEHWVESGSNWEPLIEPGQKEESMTKRQLKIVDSTPESRAEDGRKCRLAAFGAALRDRAYDTEDGFDNKSLRAAFEAILNTSSLVGPLREQEIEFYLEWLPRAYRSKSTDLGLGEDKVPVAADGFCVHATDKTPKNKLGSRPLPGLHTGDEHVFEPRVEEPDDFMLPETLSNGKKCTLPPNSTQYIPKKVVKYRQEPKKERENPEASKKRSRGDDPHVSSEPAKKRGARSEGNPFRVDYTMASRTNSIAAMVPSAVKKRGSMRGSGKRGWAEVSELTPTSKQAISPKPRKVLRNRTRPDGLKGLETIVDYSDLVERNIQDSVLRKHGRRGRPPRFLEFTTFLVIDDCDFDEDTDFEEASKAEELRENSPSKYTGNGNEPGGESCNESGSHTRTQQSQNNATKETSKEIYERARAAESDVDNAANPPHRIEELNPQVSDEKMKSTGSYQTSGEGRTSTVENNLVHSTRETQDDRTKEKDTMEQQQSCTSASALSTPGKAGEKRRSTRHQKAQELSFKAPEEDEMEAQSDLFPEVRERKQQASRSRRVTQRYSPAPQSQSSRTASAEKPGGSEVSRSSKPNEDLRSTDGDDASFAPENNDSQDLTDEPSAPKEGPLVPKRTTRQRGGLDTDTNEQALRRLGSLRNHGKIPSYTEDDEDSIPLSMLLSPNKYMARSNVSNGNQQALANESARENESNEESIRGNMSLEKKGAQIELENTPTRRGRRRGKLEAARTIFDEED